MWIASQDNIEREAEVSVIETVDNPIELTEMVSSNWQMVVVKDE